MKLFVAKPRAGVHRSILYTLFALGFLGIVIFLGSLHVLQMPSSLDFDPSTLQEYKNPREMLRLGHEFDPWDENNTHPLVHPTTLKTPANSTRNAYSVVTENRLARRHSLVPGFFIFGDSTVACGNNNSLGSFARANHPPYGRDFDTHVATGRLSNGRLVVDYLASLMAMPLVQPFPGEAGRIETMARGLNFASAGARVWHPSDSDQGQRILLTQQIAQATETFEQISSILGRESTQQIISKSIIYISIGSVDYIDSYQRNPLLFSSSRWPWDFNKFLVDAISTEVENLYNANARKFVCVGLGPLGCAPHFLWERNSTNGECIEEINNMVMAYNSVLRYKLDQLMNRLSGSSIIFCNMYDADMDIVQNPGSYGFKTARDACCGLGKYGGDIICSNANMACADASSHVWWDAYYPTDRVNSIMADNIWSGKRMSICNPMNLHDLAMG